MLCHALNECQSVWSPSAGIVRSELYKIANVQTPYGVPVQAIVDVSLML
jgi:hypothetical protein